VERARAQDAARPMQLEVVLNGNPTKLIGSFSMLDGNRLAATRQELRELGLDPRGSTTSPDQVVVLDEMFGVSYRYEEATQRVLITAPEEQLAVKEYNLRSAPELTPFSPTGAASSTIISSPRVSATSMAVRSRSTACRSRSMACQPSSPELRSRSMARRRRSMRAPFTPFGTL